MGYNIIYIIFLFCFVFFIAAFDIFVEIFILSFGSVIYLSYLRNVRLKISGKRLALALAVSMAGTIAVGTILYKSASAGYWIRVESEGLLSSGDASIVFDFRSFLIVFVAACASALIMLDKISLKRVLTVISYLLLLTILKVYIHYFFCKYISERCVGFSESFWYCCLVMITVIVFLIVQPKSSSASRLKKRNILFYSVVLALYIGVNYAMTFWGESQTDIYRFSVSGFVFTLLDIIILSMVFVLMYYLVKNVSAQSNYEYIEKNEVSEMKSADLYQKRNEEISKYLHDLPKHLDIIQSMAFQKGEEELASYVRTLTENYHKAKKKVTSGNNKLDLILSMKRDEAKKNNIEIVFSGVFPEYVKISDTDLRTVFSNAIDNALKNCKDTEKQGKVRINSSTDGDSVIITVISPRSSAESKHGFLGSGSDFSRFRKYIIKSTVRDYDGAMTWEIDDSSWKLIFSMKYK